MLCAAKIYGCDSLLRFECEPKFLWLPKAMTRRCLHFRVPKVAKGSEPNVMDGVDFLWWILLFLWGSEDPCKNFFYSFSIPDNESFGQWGLGSEPFFFLGSDPF